MRRLAGAFLALSLLAAPALAGPLTTLGAGKPPGGGGGSFTTLDSSKVSSNVTLSGGNLTLTANAGSDGIACTVASVTTGQRWAEFKVLATSGPGPWVGVYNGSGGYGIGVWAGSSTNVAGGYTGAGPVWAIIGPSNPDHGSDAVLTTAANGYIMLLVDKTNTTYTGVGGGTNAAGVFWFRSAGGDSQTYPLPSGTLYICGGTSNSGDSMSANFGQASAVNTVPGGYSPP